MQPLRIRGVPEEGTKELARLIQSRAPHLCCTACRHRDFAILEQPGAGYRTVLKRSHLDEAGTPYGHRLTQPLVTLVCTTCGRLYQFAEAALRGADPKLYGETISDE